VRIREEAPGDILEPIARTRRPASIATADNGMVEELTTLRLRLKPPHGAEPIVQKEGGREP